MLSYFQVKTCSLQVRKKGEGSISVIRGEGYMVFSKKERERQE